MERMAVEMELNLGDKIDLLDENDVRRQNIFRLIESMTHFISGVLSSCNNWAESSPYQVGDI
jgi:hypothetical protein